MMPTYLADFIKLGQALSLPHCAQPQEKPFSPTLLQILLPFMVYLKPLLIGSPPRLPLSPSVHPACHLPFILLDLGLRPWTNYLLHGVKVW